ncbi:MAG: phosphatidate cytidylyltransferase [Chloroflexi bacterium]|nr:phosphatidate cytidylyltransferase [Chloroflexota bacterium]
MLKKRIITSAIGIPVLVAAIWFDRPIPWFTLFMAACGLTALGEFYRIIPIKIPPLVYFGMTLSVFFIASPDLNYDFLIPLLLTSAIILPLVYLLFRRQKEGAFLNWAWTMAGLLYLGWLLSYWVALRGVDSGRDWVFLAMFTTFAGDTAAFFVGRTWGKRHLAPLVSPGKTWEGAFGGVLGAMLASLLFTTVLSLPIGYGQAVLLGLLISVFAQLGDLVESLFKRNMGIKDSGKLLPGHGGMLDRLDSLTFAAVVVYYYVIWVIR